MCYPTKCGTCSKTTWAGCGRHVPSVWENVPKGQACMCKGWPGVDLPTQKNCTEDTEKADSSSPTPVAGTTSATK